MIAPFWRSEGAVREPPRGLSGAAAWLAPLSYEDGRFYDLCEVRVCDNTGHDQGYEAPRWIVTMEAQERASGDNLLFVARVMWGAVRRDALRDHSPHRGQALALMARERVEEYLRFHRFPAQCCNQLSPILLEIA